VRRVFSSVDEDEEENEDENEDEEENEEEEEDEGYRNIKKKKTKAKKKLLQESPPQAAAKKKAGIANLLGKRKAANQGEQKRRGQDEDLNDEDESSRGRRSGRSKQKPTESPPTEGGRSKRRRGDLDDDIELQFSVVGLGDLINGMLNHKDGWPFDRPITKSEAPDYHKIIKTPMDLGTIRSKLNSLKYTCNQEVLDDIRLMFQNCYSYNKEDADEYKCGTRLQKYFNKEVAKMGLAEASEPEQPPVKKPASKKSRRTF